MKNLLFSALIFCGFLLGAAQTNGQTLHAHSKNDNLNVNENIVVLRWSTADERNVDRYVIEKSTDSILFNPLHEVVPHSSTDAAIDSAYRDEDPYPASPTNYYRLVTVLKDGNNIYSPVVRVDVSHAHSPLQLPALLNVNGGLRLENFYNQPLIVDLYDEGGAHVASYAVNDASFLINTANLSQNVLIYRILDEHHAFINAGKIMLQ